MTANGVRVWVLLLTLTGVVFTTVIVRAERDNDEPSKADIELLEESIRAWSYPELNTPVPELTSEQKKVPGVEKWNRHMHRYRWQRDRFKQLAEQADTSDAPHFVERSLEHQSILAEMLVEEIDAFLDTPAEPGSPEAKRFTDRTMTLHVAINDRVRIIESYIANPNELTWP